MVVVQAINRLVGLGVSEIPLIFNFSLPMYGAWKWCLN